MDLPGAAWHGKCVNCYVMYGTFDHEGKRVVYDKVCGSKTAWSYFATNSDLWIHFMCVRQGHTSFKGLKLNFKLHYAGKLYLEIKIISFMNE